MLKFFSLIRSKYWDWHYKYHLKEFEEISSRIKNHPARFITTCTIPFRSKMDKSDAAWNNDLVYSSEGSEIGSGIELFPTSLDPIRIFICLEGSTEGDVVTIAMFEKWQEHSRHVTRHFTGGKDFKFSYIFCFYPSDLSTKVSLRFRIGADKGSVILSNYEFFEVKN